MAMNNLPRKTTISAGRNIKCNHHWVISGPEGPVSNGNCKYCGAEKEFMNYFEGSTWGSDISLDQIGKGDRYTGESGITTVAETIKSEEAF